MISCENRTGKLVEMRWIHPVTPPELEKARAFMSQIEKLYQGTNVNIIDMRRGGVSTQDIVSASIDRLHHSTPPKRAAILLENSAIQRMQIDRILKQGGAQRERGGFFTDPDEALAFIKNDLTADEYARAKAFLDDVPAASAAAR